MFFEYLYTLVKGPVDVFVYLYTLVKGPVHIFINFGQETTCMYFEVWSRGQYMFL